MNHDINITILNNIYAKIECDESILQELSEYFTFDAPNAKYSPKFKERHWDGKIRLLNKKTKKIYVGLIRYINSFCSEFNYTFIITNAPTNNSVVDIKPFVDNLKLPSHIETRIYQLVNVAYALTNKRTVLISPTGSGKSLIIYIIIRYLLKYGKKRGLLIVPTVNLVRQMYTDFESYSVENNWNVDDHCQQIYQGQDKNPNSNLVISTWQSIYEMEPKYFEQFDFIIGDEAHHFQAKSLVHIMENLINCDVRIGTTGTLDNEKVHKLLLEGLFGKTFQLKTTKELQDENVLAPLIIKCICMKYPEDECKLVSKMDYNEEIDYICRHKRRSSFIEKLAMSLEGNVLILFNFVDKHGKNTYENLLKVCVDRKVFYIHGGVDGEDREAIRKIVIKENNAIIVASYGTMSTGVNIPNLDDVILSSPTKSKKRLLQSIGRELRISDGKDTATLYDIVDNFIYDNEYNYTIKQFEERVKIYSQEKFKFKIINVKV